MTKIQYDLYINLPSTGVVQAADVIILEQPGKGAKVGFRYTPGYLGHAQAISIDPAQ